MATVAVAGPRGTCRRDRLRPAKSMVTVRRLFSGWEGAAWNNMGALHGTIVPWGWPGEAGYRGQARRWSRRGGVSVAAIPLLLQLWPIVGNRTMAADSS